MIKGCFPVCHVVEPLPSPSLFTDEQCRLDIGTLYTGYNKSHANIAVTMETSVFPLQGYYFCHIAAKQRYHTLYCWKNVFNTFWNQMFSFPTRRKKKKKKNIYIYTGKKSTKTHGRAKTSHWSFHFYNFLLFIIWTTLFWYHVIIEVYKSKFYPAVMN